MTPMQKRRIDQLIDKGQIETARTLLRKLPDDKDAQTLLADMAITYPETALVKGVKAANKLIFYVLAGIVGLMLIAVIFAVIWTKIPR